MKHLDGAGEEEEEEENDDDDATNTSSLWRTKGYKVSESEFLGYNFF